MGMGKNKKTSQSTTIKQYQQTAQSQHHKHQQPPNQKQHWTILITIPSESSKNSSVNYMHNWISLRGLWKP